MRHLRKIGIVAAIVAAFGLGAFVRPSASEMASPQLFNDVFKFVAQRFVDSLDNSALYEKAARGLVDELHDPYAELYDPEQLKEFAVMAEGHYAGVGMVVEDQSGAIVSRVFPRTPAEEAGVQEGDRIVALNDSSTKGWSLDKVTKTLKGQEGTRVRATFSRPGVVKPIVIEFTRRIIHIPAVPYATLLPGGVGYVPLQQFNETAGQETGESVKSLVAQGARSIVLDMRGNGGGLVNEAVKVANLFLPQGSEVAAQRERGRAPLIYVARNQPVAPSLPLVVLVDSTSASATEIVTGALQDHDRALVVGGRTFGKGLVQSVFDLDDGYALKLTTGKWYTPSGRSIHRDRKLIDGRLILVDSAAADSGKAVPTLMYKSDAGRTILGGGGIVPDVSVRQDTLTNAEKKLEEAFRPKSREVYLAIYKYAWELKAQVNRPDFVVTPAMREGLRQRLLAAGVQVPLADWQAASGFVDRILGDRIVRFAFGDAAMLRRDFSDDSQLTRAVELLRSGSTQRALFAAAAGRNGGS